MTYPRFPEDEDKEVDRRGISRGALVGVLLLVAFLGLVVALHLTGVLGESTH